MERWQISYSISLWWELGNDETALAHWNERCPLALAQTDEIVDLLKKRRTPYSMRVVPIRTQGDKMHDTGAVRVEGKSLFTKEIEDSLIQGEVDLAVHSMKDLTTDIPPGLLIAAVPERVNPRDVLISRNRKFQQLDGGARIGTSSVEEERATPRGAG